MTLLWGTNYQRIIIIIIILKEWVRSQNPKLILKIWFNKKIKKR